MKGINLNKPIIYKMASMRYFNKNESHINRFSTDDILLMVFDGVLRFSEDGVPTEVGKGEYYIQRANCLQEGYAPSDCPKYLYVHFQGEWGNNDILLQRGSFDYEKLKDKMNEMDSLSHGEYNYTERCSKFYEILCALNSKSKKINTANKIAMFIENEDLSTLSLEKICHKFNFSKNHIINIFKKEYGVTPVNYINSVKLKRAKYLLEVTSHTAEVVASQSGFNDYSHFYKLFFKQNGMSPITWRKKNQV